MTERGHRTADYDYHLPPERVAQEPLATRDESRLMIVHRADGRIEHATFHDLATRIPAGDALVVNDTRVFRARLLGARASGAPAEVLLLRRMGDAATFEAMVHPGGKLKPGRRVQVGEQLEVEILETTPQRTRLVRLHTALAIDEAIDRHGHVPLPPYIHRGDRPADDARYQTVYAAVRGSVAAPTAGLHFTPELLEEVARHGVELVRLVLHVGAGTFKPVEVDDPAEHRMHGEWFKLSPSAAARLNATRERGARVWAVGTTSARTLETCARPGGFVAGEGETRLFIRPGHHFAGVDRLITNFHLPRSTLLMLVAAFAGYELTMHAYRVAVEAGYRFYSYGDAMLIV